jgi:hypothetical protein
MNGVARGAEAVRSIVTCIRTLYDDQEFNFAGPYGENGFLEDYTARVRGEQIGNVVLVTRNAAGQAQHIVANYRPRNTLLLLSRLIGEQLADTPYGEHFASSGRAAPAAADDRRGRHRLPGRPHREDPPLHRLRRAKKNTPRPPRCRDRRSITYSLPAGGRLKHLAGAVPGEGEVRARAFLVYGSWPDGPRPASRARATASAREATCSLVRMVETVLRTVLSETTRRRAMVRLSQP